MLLVVPFTCYQYRKESLLNFQKVQFILILRFVCLHTYVLHLSLLAGGGGGVCESAFQLLADSSASLGRHFNLKLTSQRGWSQGSWSHSGKLIILCFVLLALTETEYFLSVTNVKC